MKVLSVILGIIMLICGISLFFTPLASFLGAAWVLAIAVGVFGIFGIINAIKEKCYKVNFVFSIIAILFFIFLIICTANGSLVPWSVILVIAAIFFIVKGFVEIYTSIVARASAPHTWGWGLAAGIITVIVGIYGLAHPVVLAALGGFLVAFFFISAGLNLISFTAVSSVYEDVAEQQNQR